MNRLPASDRRSQEQNAARSVFVPFAVPELRGETDTHSGMWREIMREGTRLFFRAGGGRTPVRSVLHRKRTGSRGVRYAGRPSAVGDRF